jgi:hypothetical protein
MQSQVLVVLENFAQLALETPQKTPQVEHAGFHWVSLSAGHAAPEL